MHRAKLLLKTPKLQVSEAPLLICTIGDPTAWELILTYRYYRSQYLVTDKEWADHIGWPHVLPDEVVTLILLGFKPSYNNNKMMSLRLESSLIFRSPLEEVVYENYSPRITDNRLYWNRSHIDPKIKGFWLSHLYDDEVEELRAGKKPRWFDTINE